MKKAERLVSFVVIYNNSDYQLNKFKIVDYNNCYIHEAGYLQKVVKDFIFYGGEWHCSFNMKDNTSRSWVTWGGLPV